MANKVISINGKPASYNGKMLQSSEAGGGIPEAPNDGNIYGRKNKNWIEAQEKLIAGTGISIAQDGKTISVVGGGESSILYVRVTNIDYSTFEVTLDTTFDEIAGAIESGKYVVMFAPGLNLFLTPMQKEENFIYFNLSSAFYKGYRSGGAVIVRSDNTARMIMNQYGEVVPVDPSSSGFNIDEYSHDAILLITTGEGSGHYYKYINGSWQDITPSGGGVPEVPDDGKLYGRKFNDWEEAQKKLITGSGISIAADGKTISTPALLPTAQILTDTEKAQVLTNLGLSTEDWTITYDDETTETITIVKKV